MKAIIYCAVVLTLAVVGVTSLKCYVCDSITSKTGCGHGTSVEPIFLKDCDEVLKDEESSKVGLTPPENVTFTICRKIVTTVDFDVNTNKKGERINRVCGWETSKYDNECYYRGGLGGRTTVCSCTKSECNGASGMSAAIATIILPAFYFMVKNLSS